MGRREGLADEWRGLGEVYAARGDADAARAAFAKAKRIYAEVGMPHKSVEVERLTAGLGERP
jgi:cytochrome c-type biogenesis protein CcmH/NrfG